ncbi:hypothetical protein D1007_00174 [Hordeum vulgare]|nr:hypothetical protein D1007_00174 [Hordeum vulgare]
MRRSRSRPPVPLPSLVVREQDQAALAVVYRESEEDEQHRATTAEQEEAGYEAAMAQAMALSTASDCVLPPVISPSPVKAQLEPEPSPIKRYFWTGVVRAPLVWVRASSAEEAVYLADWRQRWAHAPTQMRKRTSVFTIHYLRLGLLAHLIFGVKL